MTVWPNRCAPLSSKSNPPVAWSRISIPAFWISPPLLTTKRCISAGGSAKTASAFIMASAKVLLGASPSIRATPARRIRSSSTTRGSPRQRPTREGFIVTSHPDNRLKGSASPYLRSAAHQPIGWFEWGEEAFARARAEDKPILLDIGAVWCHWCHVIDRESYENAEIAEIIN